MFRITSMQFHRVLVFITPLLCATGALSQSTQQNSDSETESVNQGTDFQITHYTIDAGYEEISGGDFFMRGIIGQPDTGISQGSDTVFIGGFLQPAAPLNSEFLLIDGFEFTP